MTTTPNPPAPAKTSELIKFNIPKGWSALYEPNAKNVLVLKEFPNGGSANSKLSLISKATKAELMAEITTLGLTWIPPVAPAESTK